jgi:hypothetical protein
MRNISPPGRIQSVDLLSHDAFNKPDIFSSTYPSPGNLMRITPAARVPGLGYKKDTAMFESLLHTVETNIV